MSEHNEAKHLGGISSKGLTEELGVMEAGAASEVQPRSISPAKYMRLQNDTAYTRIIPYFGLCSNAKCSPQYEKCVKCDHFRPDSLYLEYFTQTREIIQKRLLKFMKTGGTPASVTFEQKQLEIVNEYIERLSADRTSTPASAMSSFGKGESRDTYGTA